MKNLVILIFTVLLSINAQAICMLKPVDGCDMIILKDGTPIQANIISMSATEVQYKRCGKSTDPIMILAKSECLTIQSSQGEILYRKSAKVVEEEKQVASYKPVEQPKQKIDWTGIVALVFSVSVILKKRQSFK